MNREELFDLLSSVQEGRVAVSEALERLVHYPVRDLGCARLDLHRELRSGFAEVVFAAGKSTEDLLQIVGALQRDLGRVLITRLRPEHIVPLKENFPELVLHPVCAAAHSKIPQNASAQGRIGVVTAGTSDRSVAEEATVCAQYFGLEVTPINDIGVAGLHRLFQALPEVEALDLLIVIAGMEGALPGIIAGICPVPVIAVPTSVGYGASFGGITAFLSMLVSCSPGLTVVNIDNGFGAALAAARIIRHIRKEATANNSENKR